MQLGYFTLTDNPPSYGADRRDPNQFLREVLDEGVLAEDDQVRTRFNVSCVASGDTGMQTGYESLARTQGFEIFEGGGVEEVARKAAARSSSRRTRARTGRPRPRSRPTTARPTPPS